MARSVRLMRLTLYLLVGLLLGGVGTYASAGCLTGSYTCQPQGVYDTQPHAYNAAVPVYQYWGTGSLTTDNSSGCVTVRNQSAGVAGCYGEQHSGGGTTYLLSWGWQSSCPTGSSVNATTGRCEAACTGGTLSVDGLSCGCPVGQVVTNGVCVTAPPTCVAANLGMSGYVGPGDVTGSYCENSCAVSYTYSIDINGPNGAQSQCVENAQGQRYCTLSMYRTTTSCTGSTAHTTGTGSTAGQLATGGQSASAVASSAADSAQAQAVIAASAAATAKGAGSTAAGVAAANSASAAAVAASHQVDLAIAAASQADSDATYARSIANTTGYAADITAADAAQAAATAADAALSRAQFALSAANQSANAAAASSASPVPTPPAPTIQDSPGSPLCGIAGYPACAPVPLPSQSQGSGCGGAGQPACNAAAVAACGGEGQPACTVAVMGACGGPNQPPCKTISANPGTFTGNCLAGFTCGGDAVQCAVARASWIQVCSMQELAGTPAAILGSSLLNGGTDIAPGGQVIPTKLNGSTLDLQAKMVEAQGSRTLTASCIPSPSFTVGGHSFTVNLSDYCNTLAIAGNLFAALTLLVAVRIVGKGTS